MRVLILLSLKRNSPYFQTMRDPTGQDTEGLLPKEHLLGVETTQFTGRTVLKSWQKHSLTILTILGITNIITLGAALFLLATRQSHTPCVNQPPQGIAPSLAHLSRKPKSQLLNVTFYPDGTPWREHDSIEADEVWAEYTQAGESYITKPIIASSIINRRRSPHLRWRIYHDPQRRSRGSRHRSLAARLR